MRDIEEGEELCIDYGRVWFLDVDRCSGNGNEDEGGDGSGERLGDREDGDGDGDLKGIQVDLIS